jgi:hypothetical protein
MASNELARELLPSLMRGIARAVRSASRDDATDAVEDALLEYLARPGRFDPSRGIPLERYLHIAAVRNLRDRWRQNIRRAARERAYADEVARIANIRPASAAPPRKITATLKGVCAPGEEPAVRAWLAGEQRTTALAQLLDLAHLSASEQRAEVKRFKDRLAKRLAAALLTQGTPKESHG